MRGAYSCWGKSDCMRGSSWVVIVVVAYVVVVCVLNGVVGFVEVIWSFNMSGSSWAGQRILVCVEVVRIWSGCLYHGSYCNGFKVMVGNFC